MFGPQATDSETKWTADIKAKASAETEQRSERLMDQNKTLKTINGARAWNTRDVM